MAMKPLLVAALALGAGPAAAATIAYDFTASFGGSRLTEFEVDVPPDFFEGTLAGRAGELSAISGTLTFDDALTFGDEGFAAYPPYRLAVDELDLSDVNAPPEAVVVFNDGLAASGGFSDEVSDSTTSPGLPGFENGFSLRFADEDGGALSSAVPFPELVLADWDTATLSFFSSIDVDGGFAGLNVQFDLTSLSRLEAPPAPIPLPAAGTLLAAALGLLAVQARRRS